jgi:hypothetical protein
MLFELNAHYCLKPLPKSVSAKLSFDVHPGKDTHTSCYRAVVADSFHCRGEYLLCKKFLLGLYKENDSTTKVVLDRNVRPPQVLGHTEILLLRR